ncbi:hypothetical protein L7F22_054948 [Adiantum nelumboides]|nr:hypothetical protein [Adiantum nelumboides]
MATDQTKQDGGASSTQRQLSCGDRHPILATPAVDESTANVTTSSLQLINEHPGLLDSLPDFDPCANPTAHDSPQLINEHPVLLDSLPDFDPCANPTAQGSPQLINEHPGLLDSLPDFDPCANPTANSGEMAANQTESVGRTSIQAMEISAPGGSRPEAEANSRLTYSNLLQQWINSRWGEARPSSHLSSGSTANSSTPIYSRLFSIAESIGSSVYSNSGLSRVLSQPSSHGSSIPRPPSAVQIYENHLDTVRWAARSVGSFYQFSTFLAVCSLTWASVVLLGAFVSYLPFVDYAMITFLVLLDAIRLASAAFFTILLTHGLARQSQDPENIIHGKDDHYRRAFAARIVSSIVQAILILPNFICPIIRYPNIHYQGRNLYLSLFIFYTFIIVNAFVALISLICSSASFIHFRDRYNQSALRFYDELVMRAISFGVIQADDFGYFGFAYKMLGSEYARIIQPEAVVKNHRKLIEYLYRHRLGQDFLLIFLDKGDAFVQQAALNMPGFWADPSKRIGLEEVKITKRVLSKMADKVGEGQVGWAATNSFGGIARRDPRILAETRTSDGVPLLERLAELVNGRSSSSLNYVRTLALFYHYSYKKEKIVPALLQGRELVRKLKQLLEGASVQRARLFAAYLLHLMGQLDEGSYDAVFAINPTKGRDTNWFKGELDLLNFIRKQCNVNVKEVQPDDVPEGFLRTDDNRCPNGIEYL